MYDESSKVHSPNIVYVCTIMRKITARYLIVEFSVIGNECHVSIMLIEYGNECHVTVDDTKLTFIF